MLVEDPVAVLVGESEGCITNQGSLPGSIFAGAQLEVELAHTVVDVDVAISIGIVDIR